MADPFWGPDGLTNDGTFDIEEFFSLSSAITNGLASDDNVVPGNGFAGSQAVFTNPASTLPHSHDHISQTDNTSQSDVYDHFVDATALGSEAQSLYCGQSPADPQEPGSQEMSNNLWFGYTEDQALNSLFPPKPVIPYQHQERTLVPLEHGQPQPAPTFRFALQDEFRQIDNWGFPLPVDPIPDPQFEMGTEAFRLSRLQNQASHNAFLLQQETERRFGAGLIRYNDQVRLQQYQEAPFAASNFNSQGLKMQPSTGKASNKRRYDDAATFSDADDKHPSDSQIKRLKINAGDLDIQGDVAQSSLGRPLRPNNKRIRDDTSVPLASDDNALDPSKNKRTKVSGKRSCMFCRCKGTRCQNENDGERCRCCQARYDALPADLKTDPPTMKEMTFVATEDLLQHMGRLRKELVVESNLKEFDSKYDTILCHFEPFRQGHTPFQLSDSNRPIAICKYANKPGSLSSNMTYSLDKSSMHAFMSRFAMGSIPPSLRDINNGVISTALQFCLWYGILSQLEQNKIFQARNISTIETKQTLQIILSSVILAMEDLLTMIRVNINNTGRDTQEAKRNLCALWIMYRFMNTHKKSTANLAASSLVGLRKTIYEFESHLYDRTKAILPRLQKFRTDYGAYFCTMEEGDKLQSYIDLIAWQPKLKPLINITIERHSPGLPVGLLDIMISIYDSRSFGQTLEATGSALEDCLSRLTLELDGKSVPESLPSPPKVRHPLTQKNLEQLQLELGFCVSPAEFERESDVESSADGAGAGDWASEATVRPHNASTPRSNRPKRATKSPSVVVVS